MGRLRPQSNRFRLRATSTSEVPIKPTPLPILRRKKQFTEKHQRRLHPLREPDRQDLARISGETVAIAVDGYYVDEQSGMMNNIAYQVSASVEKTCIYSPGSTGLIDNWQDGPRLLSLSPGQQTQIKFFEVPLLTGARDLSRVLQDARDGGGIGFLNCSSAKRPGGGFRKGGTEPEECLARASTINASLTSSVARPFYRAHRHDDAAGFYDHQIIFSPHVVVIRNDRRPTDVMETGGGNLSPPLHISVVSSCAINARQIHRFYKHVTEKKEVNRQIEMVMRARMARVLRVFEERGIKNLILGAFGVGQPFYNDVETVARIWAELLACPGATFGHVFDRVWFPIDSPFHRRFKAAFESRIFEEELTLALTTEEPDVEDWERVS
ncbi:hypothetical protein BU17DRAFT_92505 [Hysterangium stoloniferum]|nr:hypothetical protein BU17DRAFT_92505 [Hysterangium stoloniferum]